MTEGRNAEAVKMEYKDKDKEVKKCCKKDKQKWFDDKAAEAEWTDQVGDTNFTKTIYRIVKEISGSHQQHPPVKLADGQRASTREPQIQRWHQHFQAVFNCPEPESVHSFEEEEPVTVDVSLEPVTNDEVRKAIKKLKNGKSAGIDQIQPELLKSLTTSIPVLTKLCNDIWTSKSVPSD